MGKRKATNSENRIRHCLGSCSGMTLTEMLAAVLILSMTAVAVAGGVVAVRDAFRKTTEKAEAQLVLATTAELMTDILSGAVDVRDGGTDGPEFLDGETGSWLRLQAVPYTDGQENRSGICRVYVDDAGQETFVPLLSDGAMAKRFYTDFDSENYSYVDGCFTVEDINVYYKQDAEAESSVPMAHLDRLTVRAVNLEGIN